MTIKIIEKSLRYNERAMKSSNKILNVISYSAFLLTFVITIFFRNTPLYSWFNIIVWVALFTHPYIQLKIKNIIKETKLTNKMLKSEETDWMVLK